MSTILPGTTPPPSSASNSEIPVEIRSTAPLSTSVNLSGAATRGPSRPSEGRLRCAAGASVNVFHASHPGQRPSQRGDSWPHDEQKKTERFLPVARVDFEVGRSPLISRPFVRRRRSPTGPLGLRAKPSLASMKEYPHVAIDGPVASGKTTAARSVAASLGTLYLDTGAMYRAVAHATLSAGVRSDDEAGVLAMLAASPVLVEPDSAAPLGFRITCGGRELGPELFDRRVEAVVSTVAALPLVRKEMVRSQRAIAALGPVVMAGRDIGTVVLPDAKVKVFLTASVTRESPAG